MDEIELIRKLYRHFNARDIDAVLAFVSENVDWANGMRGGHVHGPEALRFYWSEQWSQINPHVEPIRFEQAGDGSVSVEVHQVVHDLQGALLLDEMVRHVFHLQQGRVLRFDIESASQLSAISH